MEIERLNDITPAETNYSGSIESRTAIMDYHVHERRSRDVQEATVESYIKTAELRGIDEIAFTTHLIISGPDVDTGICKEEIPEYVGEIWEAQETTDVRLRVGFEVDYFPHEERRLESLLDEYDLDFVLGSVHVVNGWDIGKKDEVKRFFLERPLEEAVDEYFETWRSAVESGLFDVMAHPDYFRRSICKFRKPINWQEYGSMVFESIESLASNDVGFEINTSGYRHGIGDNFPIRGFLMAAREAGVKRVTVGSDSHITETLGCGLCEAVEELKDVGFKTISVFRNRRNNKIPIDQVVVGRASLDENQGVI